LGISAQLKIATFTQDSPQGAFAEDFTKFVRENPKITLIDAAPFVEKMESIKCLPEQVLLLMKQIIGNYEEMQQVFGLFLHTGNWPD